MTSDQQKIMVACKLLGWSENDLERAIEIIETDPSARSIKECSWLKTNLRDETFIRSIARRAGRDAANHA